MSGIEDSLAESFGSSHSRSIHCEMNMVLTLGTDTPVDPNLLYQWVSSYTAREWTDEAYESTQLPHF